MATVTQSRDFRSSIPHLPSTMGVGDVHPTSSTRSELNSTSSNVPHPSHGPAAPFAGTVDPSSALPTRTTSSVSVGNKSRSSTVTQASQLGGVQLAGHHRQEALPTSQVAQTESQEPGLAGSHYNGNHINEEPGSIPPSPRLGPTQRSVLSFTGSGSTSPARIKVRDLGHIQSFASEEVLTRSRRGSTHSLRGRKALGQQYEISAMPVSDIIEMVAGLLTKITTTNDRQHEHLHRHVPPPEGSSGLSQQTSSVLAFHGKNVPSISILAYLSRIHKYCPTTYEVFLSLLVYFDRMTEMINNGTLPVFNGEAQAQDRDKEATVPNSSDSARTMTAPATPPPSELSDSMQTDPNSGAEPDTESDAYKLSHFFVVDSFNIHRLVIAGVTCASKFFSDVFYTNSRYAKV